MTTSGHHNNPTSLASAANELPLYLTAGRERVFAIATLPSVPASGMAVLCLHAGATSLTPHRNRMYTRLCREAAGFGVLAMRMDYHGTGDSSGVLQDRGIHGQTVEDVSAAVRWLTEHGAEQVLVVGTCWGALVALVIAAEHEAITSLCLISPPMALLQTGAGATERRERHEPAGRALRQALRPHVIRLLMVEQDYRRWLLRRVRRRAERLIAGRSCWSAPSLRADDHAEASPNAFLAPLVRRGVSLRLLFGDQDSGYRDMRQRNGLQILDTASEIVDITVVPSRLHGFATLRAQEVTLDYVRTCLARDLGFVAAEAPDSGSQLPA